MIIDTVWDNEIEAVDGWRFTWRSKIPEMQRRVCSFLQGVQNLVLSVTKFCGRGRIPCSACEGEENTEKTYCRRWYLNWVLKYLWASLSSFIKQEKWTRSTSYVLSLKRTLWLRKILLINTEEIENYKKPYSVGNNGQGIGDYIYAFLSEGVAREKFKNFNVKLEAQGKEWALLLTTAPRCT